MSGSEGGVVVTTYGNGLVVHPPDGPAMPELVAAVEQLPLEPGYVPVAVSPLIPLTDDAVLAIVAHEVGRRVRRWRPRQTGIRLAVPYAGRGPDAVAERLARLVRRPVVAPDGPIWIGVDQSLLVGPSGDGHGGRWRTFVLADSGPNSGLSGPNSGPRHPAPPWQPPGIPHTGPGTVDIPAGWWLTSPWFSPHTPEELPFDLVPAPGRCLLVIGGPGAEPVTADRVVAQLRALPPSTRETCVLVGHDSRHPAAPLASEVARTLGEPVRHGGGLPMMTADGTEQWFVAHQGELVQAGFMELAEALPAAGHRVLASRPPLASWPATDGPAWPLVEGWTAEVIVAGLWLRPADVTPARAEAVRTRVAPDPAAMSVIVEPGTHDTAELPAEVLTHLLARLPAGQRERATVVRPAAAQR